MLTGKVYIPHTVKVSTCCFHWPNLMLTRSHYRKVFFGDDHEKVKYAKVAIGNQFETRCSESNVILCIIIVILCTI